MPELGNRSIATHKLKIEIDDPSAVPELLQLAIACHRQKRRVLFFCACKDLKTKTCHRRKVANLVRKEAKRQHRRIEIVEWPGYRPTYNTTVKVKPSILKKVKVGRKSVLLGKNVDLRRFAGLPWGSVVILQDGKEELPIASGPAKHHDNWCLPVVHPGKIGGDAAERLKQWGVSFRKEKGLD